MKKLRVLLSVLLVVCMVVGFAPMRGTASAAREDWEWYWSEECRNRGCWNGWSYCDGWYELSDKWYQVEFNTVRVPVEVNVPGTASNGTATAAGSTTQMVGTSFSYFYNEWAGTLIIRGTGEMPSFSKEHPAPWANLKDKAARVILERNITKISSNAFVDFSRLRSVVLPATLKAIDPDAFVWSDATRELKTFRKLERLETSGDLEVLGKVLEAANIKDLLDARVVQVTEQAIQNEIWQLTWYRIRKPVRFKYDKAGRPILIERVDKDGNYFKTAITWDDTLADGNVHSSSQPLSSDTEAAGKDFSRDVIEKRETYSVTPQGVEHLYEFEKNDLGQTTYSAAFHLDNGVITGGTQTFADENGVTKTGTLKSITKVGEDTYRLWENVLANGGGFEDMLEILDKFGRVKSISTSNGDLVENTYKDNGLLESRTVVESGSVTTYTYNYNGAALDSVDAKTDGNITNTVKYTYHDNGAMETKVQKQGSSTVTTYYGLYNRAGREVITENGKIQLVYEYTYDKNGVVSKRFVKDANGKVTRVDTFENGHVVKTVKQEPTVNNTLSFTVSTFSYTTDGVLTGEETTSLSVAPKLMMALATDSTGNVDAATIDAAAIDAGMLDAAKTDAAAETSDSAKAAAATTGGEAAQKAAEGTKSADSETPTATAGGEATKESAEGTKSAGSEIPAGEEGGEVAKEGAEGTKSADSETPTGEEGEPTTMDVAVADLVAAGGVTDPAADLGSTNALQLSLNSDAFDLVGLTSVRKVIDPASQNIMMQSTQSFVDGGKFIGSQDLAFTETGDLQGVSTGITIDNGVASQTDEYKAGFNYDADNKLFQVDEQSKDFNDTQISAENKIGMLGMPISRNAVRTTSDGTQSRNVSLYSYRSSGESLEAKTEFDMFNNIIDYDIISHDAPEQDADVIDDETDVTEGDDAKTVGKDEKTEEVEDTVTPLAAPEKPSAAQKAEIVMEASEPASSEPAVIQQDAPAPVETKAEDPAPAEAKAEDPAQAETKAEDPAPVETKADAPAPVETKSEAPAPAETKADAPAPVETKSEAPALVETKADAPAPAETKAEDPAQIETKAEAPAPVEAKAEDPAPVETKSEDPAPAEVQQEAPAPVEVQQEVPALVEVQQEAPAPVEVQQEAPAPVEVQQETPAPVEVQQEAPAPAEVQQEAPAPVEVQQEAPAPAEVQQEAPAPVEVQQEAPAPVEVQQEAPAPVEVQQEAPAPVEVQQEAPAPAEVQQEAPAPAEVQQEAPAPEPVVDSAAQEAARIAAEQAAAAQKAAEEEAARKKAAEEEAARKAAEQEAARKAAEQAAQEAARIAAEQAAQEAARIAAEQAAQEAARIAAEQAAAAAEAQQEAPAPAEVTEGEAA